VTPTNLLYNVVHDPLFTRWLRPPSLRGETVALQVVTVAGVRLCLASWLRRWLHDSAVYPQAP